jgi:hypothetical protein
MLLWKDLKDNLASFAGDGSCDSDFVAKELNKAIRRLMCSRQWKSLSSMMRMAVIDTVFPMPYNVEAVLGVSVDGRPSTILGTEYQMVSGGPGDLDSWRPLALGGTVSNLADMGEHATMFDVPLDREGYVIAAFCTSAADTAKTIRIKGMGEKNEEVQEELRLTRWEGGVEGQVSGMWGSGVAISSSAFRSVSRVILPDPALSGYVSLYAVYPSENQMYFLGKYHPSLRIPTFRRYRLTTPIVDNVSSSSGLATTGSCATVLAQVKLKFVPYVDDYDVVPFESEEAIQYMMMAANAEKTNPANGAQFEGLALRLLGEEEASKDTYRGMPIMIGSSPATSLGRQMAPFARLRGGQFHGNWRA